MPGPPIQLDGREVDLSNRFFETHAVVASPALAAETIIASLTIADLFAVQKGVFLEASAAFTVGTSGTGANLRIRRTDVNGTVLYATGACTVVATNLVNLSGQGIDPTATVVLPNQIYVVTLQITAGAAASTVSAVSLFATVV